MAKAKRTKLKTHSSCKKRFKITAKGKVKYNQMNRRHILNKKSSKRKMRLRKNAYLAPAHADNIKRLLPYAG